MHDKGASEPSASASNDCNRNQIEPREEIEKAFGSFFLAYFFPPLPSLIRFDVTRLCYALTGFPMRIRSNSFEHIQLQQLPGPTEVENSPDFTNSGIPRPEAASS